MADVFDLQAKIYLEDDGFKKGMAEAEQEADNLTSKLGRLGSGLGKGLVKAAELGSAAMIGAGTATAALAKQSVDAYSEFEQLKGGIETLYGADAQQMLNNASKAFQTAGLSANEYMETAIESSAAMINSLGGDTKKAADMTDLAIRDMSDNMNKMGTSMEGLQNAYRGFSRGNFTMLDNLSLGFAGTKEGMQQLLEKAEEISAKNGQAVKYSIDSYADMVQAIHVVQEEMGITGTTAKEAGDTISGSAGSAKKAWENLLVGFSDANADLDKLMGDLIASVSQAASNLVPRFEQALNGIAKGIDKIAPVIGEAIPKIVTKFAPTIINSGKNVLMALLKGIKKNISSVKKAASEILKTLTDALVELIPMLADIGFELVNGLVEFLAENGGLLVAQAAEMITKLSDSFVANIDVFIENAIKLIETIVVGLAENADKLVDGAITIILTLAQALIDHLPEILEAAVKIVAALTEALIKNAPKLIAGAILLIATLAKGIIDHLGDIKTAAAEVIVNFLGRLAELGTQILEAGAQFIVWLTNGIASAFHLVTEYGEELKELIVKPIGDLILAAEEWGEDLIDNFVKGIKNSASNIKTAVTMLGQEVKDRIGFSEPKTGPLSDFHTFAPDMVDLFSQGIYDNLNKITNATNAMAGVVSGGVQSAETVPQAQVALAGMGDIVIPVYIGQERIDEIIVTSEQTRNYRSGGR